MLKRFVKSSLARFGYEIKKRSVEPPAPLLRVYRYVKEDGSFDYEKYRQIQTAANRLKIEWVWAVEENIAFLADYIKGMVETPKFGICHGTRRGMEQKWFKKYLGCEVIGTEISDTATQFPDTIQWDFHETKPEWINGVDFIYSNSFDHSYDPERCLNAWMSCVKPGGLCILERSSDDSACHAENEMDPFRADLVVMPYLVTVWGRGQYCVREVIKAPKQNQGLAEQYANAELPSLDFIIIERLRTNGSANALRRADTRSA